MTDGTMNKKFVTLPGHIRIPYDVTGNGPAIMLLHGGNGSRMDWHANGYVAHLQNEFPIIAVDLRDHGEREKLAVACGADHFILRGVTQ